MPSFRIIPVGSLAKLDWNIPHQTRYRRSRATGSQSVRSQASGDLGNLPFLAAGSK